MFEIILLVYFAYRNSVRAKLKGQNPVLWAFITAGAYLFAYITGAMIVIFNFCKEVNINQLSSLDAKSREAVSQQLMQEIYNNPLHMLTIELFGIGGYLLVRYIIDRKPDKKETEVHWMDKIGNNDVM